MPLCLIFLLSLMLVNQAWSTGTLNAQGEAFYNLYAKKIHYTKPSSIPATYSTGPTIYDRSPQESSSFNALGYQPIPNLYLLPYVVGNVISSQDQIVGEEQFDPLVSYQLNEKLRFLSWFELSGTTKGDAQAAVEYANLEWDPQDNIALIGGKFLSPLGKFVNTLYFPWVNKMADAPPGFEENSAVPQANIGFQTRGSFLMPHASHFNYSLFLGPGQKVVSEEGMFDYISSRAYMPGRNPNTVYGGRLAFLPITGVEVGISGARGRISLINDGIFIESGQGYSAVGADINYTKDKLDVRGEYIQQTLGANTYTILVNHAIWSAWYGQIAYKLFNTHWEAVLRYGNTSSPKNDEHYNQQAIGFNFWFSPDMAAKFSYEVNNGKFGTLSTSQVVLGQFLFRL